MYSLSKATFSIQDFKSSIKRVHPLLLLKDGDKSKKTGVRWKLCPGLQQERPQDLRKAYGRS